MKHGTIWCPNCQRQVLCIMRSLNLGAGDLFMPIGVGLLYLFVARDLPPGVGGWFALIGIGWIPLRIVVHVILSFWVRCTDCGMVTRIRFFGGTPRNTPATR